MTMLTGHATSRTVPGRGDIVPTLRGTTPDGVAISTRDFYMRHNLALLFADTSDAGVEWVREAADVAEAAAAEAGQVVVVAPGTVKTFGLPTFVEHDGSLRAAFGLEEDALPVLFITDRYGTLFVASHGVDGDASLRPADIPRWLEFVACRCS